MLIQSESKGSYLTFDDTEHTYTLNGKLVPGVTTILHHSLPTSPYLITWMSKLAGQYVVNQLKQFPEQVNKLPDYLLEEVVKKSTQASKQEAKKAADVGSIVHDYCEKIEAGIPYEMETILTHPDKDKIVNCLNKFEEWRVSNKDEITGHEEIIASVSYGFAGKFDRLCSRHGKLILSDYKTSGDIYTSYFIQLAAYAIALEEWKGLEVDGLEVLRFGKKDAKFEVELLTGKKKIQELKDQFVRCKQTYDFTQRWK